MRCTSRSTPSASTAKWSATCGANGRPILNLFDLSGHPAISVPAGLSDSGIPLAFQLVAPWYEEAKLLAAVAFYEQQHPWPLPDARP